MQLPSPDLVTDFQSRFLRDTWTETTEELALAIDTFPGSERAPGSRTARSGGFPAGWHPYSKRASFSQDVVRVHTVSTVLQRSPALTPLQPSFCSGR